METAEAIEILRRAAQGGEAALRDVAPFELHLDLVPGIATSLTEKCVHIGPRPSRLFVAALTALGARTTSGNERSWVFSLAADQEDRRIGILFDTLPLALVHPFDHLADAAAEGALSVKSNDPGRRQRFNDLARGDARIDAHIGGSTRPYAPDARFGRIAVSLGIGRLFIRLFDHPDDLPLEVSSHAGEIDLAGPLHPHDALAVVSSAVTSGWTVAGSPEAGQLLDAAANQGIVRDHPGVCGLLEAVVPGSLKVRGLTGTTERVKGPFVQRHAPLSPQDGARLLDGSAPLTTTPRAVELSAMAAAKGTGRAGLYPRQDDFVSLYLASERDVLNASDVGCGKTVMTLTAWREAASATQGFRGLVVCATAGARSQWFHDELPVHFPKARALACYGKEDIAAVRALATDTSNEPVVVVTSINLLHGAVDAFTAISWDEVAADEADFLGNSSEFQNAMWQVRQVARRGVALTGTPGEKGLRYLGRIMSWARNEPLAVEEHVKKRYIGRDAADIAALRRAVGPALFRMDTSDLAGAMPVVLPTEVARLTPTAAEAALANAARLHLRKVLLELEEALTAAGTSKQQVDTALREARGAVLGGVNMARLACLHTPAVANSSSRAAQLLDAEGYIDPALAASGTKMAWAVEQVRAAAARGERTLLFSDYSSVCAALADQLVAAGVRAGTYLGGQPARARDARRAAYMRGELDALVISSAGNRALNLQATNLLIHFDLPWTPAPLVQRVGRARRIGSTTDEVRVLAPVLAGTIEERVIAVVLPRAMNLVSTLDLARGVDPTMTGVGSALTGLVDGLGEDEAKASKVSPDLLESVRMVLAA